MPTTSRSTATNRDAEQGVWSPEAIKERPGEATASRQFWHSMVYRCDGDEFEWEVFLEDGCEGPRDGESLMTRLPMDHPFYPGQERPWPRTASGHLVVPVPFVAGRCPLHRHPMTHIAWHRDRTFDPMLREEELGDAPRFLYPSDAATDLRACGELVVP